jgi:hypothetical protein
VKYFVLALVLFAAGAGLLVFTGDEQSYVPLVRFHTSEGVYVTAVQSPAKSRSSCQAANDRFVGQLGSQCRDCTVETHCLVELAGMELALAKGDDVPVHTVLSKGARLALVGPPRTLQRSCEQLALQVGSTGNASCITPRKASRSDNQLFHPVVHLALPEGLSITALLPETDGQDACTDKNERFLSTFKVCKDCKIGFARCERELEGLELAMWEGTAVPHPVVVARGMRIAVMGPPEAASLGCRVFAADMAAKGLPSAACVEPKIVPAKR